MTDGRRFDVFLSHSGADKDAVEVVASWLRQEGIRPFFDKWDLVPGDDWQEELERALAASASVAVFVGVEEMRSWHTAEMRVSVRRATERPDGFRVIPVLLPGSDPADLPTFLAGRTWVDFRSGVDDDESRRGFLRAIERATGRTTPAARSTAGVPPTDPGDSQTSAAGVGARLSTFELRVGSHADGDYRIAAEDAPGDDQSAEAYRLDVRDIDRLLWSSAVRVAETVRTDGGVDDQRLPTRSGAVEVGAALHRSLVDSRVWRALIRRTEQLHEVADDEQLRVVINTTDAPNLGAVPWEFLHDPDQGFLFSDRYWPIVRSLDVSSPPRPLHLEPPLRMLLAIASPPGVPELAVGEELRELDAALQQVVDDGLLEINRLDHTTVASLYDALLDVEPHVLHFIGHGGVSTDGGYVTVEPREPGDPAKQLTGEQLGRLLGDHRDHLRLVFLNSCLGGASGPARSMGGVAHELVRRGMPAVIAMQFPIPDRAAIDLARGFYRAAAAGRPVDASLTMARNYLYAQDYEVEWGAPALFTRAGMTRLFDIDTSLRTSRRPSAESPLTSSGRRDVASDAVVMPASVASGTAPPVRSPESSPAADRDVTSDAVVPPSSAASGTAPPVDAPELSPAAGREEPPAALRVLPVWLMLMVAVVIAGSALGFVLVAGRDGDGDATPTPTASGAQAGTTTTTTPPALVTSPVEVAVVDASGVVDASDLLRSELEAVGYELADSTPTPIGAGVERTRVYFDATDPGARELASVLARQLGVELEIDDPDVVGGTDASVVVVIGTDIAGQRLADLGGGATATTITEPTMVTSPEGTIVTTTAPPTTAPPTTAPPTTAPPTTSGSEVPGGTIVVIEPGDTLSRIAREEYGDSHRWPQIFRVNRDTLADPDVVVPGQELRVPPLSPEAGFRWYQVERGDTLWDVAGRLLGDPTRWPDLVDANPDLATRPDLITVGQWLLVPRG